MLIKYDQHRRHNMTRRRGYLADSSRSRVADTEPLGGLTAEVRTTRRSTIEHDITNDDVVLRLETAWETFGRVDNQLTTTETLRHTQTHVTSATHGTINVCHTM